MGKRILFLVASLLSGGAERQIVTVARLLKRRGYDVSFYCYGKGDFYGHLLRDEDIPVVWDYSFNNQVKRIWKVRKYIREGNYDDVISFLPADNFLNDIAAIGGHKWKVITGLRACPVAAPKSFKDKLYAWMLRYSDTIVSNSCAAMEKWCQFRPEHKSKFSVIYNNVQIGDIQTSYRAKKDGRLHIVVAASFQELKNPKGLIESLVLMTEEERKKIVIDWYGAQVGEIYQQIFTSITSNNFEDIFKLHSPSENIYEIMNQADAVMLISHREGLPNAICEGMTLGKPIIMSRVSDFDVLVDESNGYLCDSQNPASIKDALVRLSLCTVNYLQDLGSSSRKKAEGLFSDDAITKNWESIL